MRAPRSSTASCRTTLRTLNKNVITNVDYDPSAPSGSGGDDDEQYVLVKLRTLFVKKEPVEQSDGDVGEDEKESEQEGEDEDDAESDTASDFDEFPGVEPGFLASIRSEPETLQMVREQIDAERV